MNTFPIFLKPIAESMKWGRGDLAVAILLGSMVPGIVSPLAGTLIDRIGAKKIMAMSAAFVGTSFGGMVMSPVFNWIILRYDWRTALLVSGVTIWVVVVPLILFAIRTHPREMGLNPYQTGILAGTPAQEPWGFSVKEAFSLKEFWQIGVIIFIISLAFTGLNNHCVAYLNDLGHSPTRAAFAWSLVMGSMVFGKIAFGPIADRWGAKISMAISCVLFSVSVGILIFADRYWVVMVFAGLYGFSCGAPLVINPLLTGDYLGVKNFATLFGILTITGTMGGALGPVGAGYVFDIYGSYIPVFYFLIPLMLVCALIAMVLKPAARPELSPVSELLREPV